MPNDPAVGPAEVPVAENDLFRGVDGPALSAVAALAEEVDVEEGTIIFDEGDAGDYLYMIVRGSVRISRPSPEGQYTLTYMRPGQFFGEIALCDFAPRSARATVVQPSRLARLSRRGLDVALALAPALVSANMMRSVMRSSREANALRVEEACRTERLRTVGAMAASIAHDLKSPLTVVRLLADGVASAETGSMLHRAADRMLAMVQDLLDYSRGEARVERAEVPVGGLLADLDEQASFAAARSGVRVSCRAAADGTLLADRAALVRALSNLASNAVEAMPDGGTLTIAAEPRADTLSVTVADTGCGIPDDLLPLVFEPFATFGKRGGTGFGMATAKAIVEAHGGGICVRSRPGEGTTVEVTLPGFTPSHAPCAERPEAEASGAPTYG
jgi:signal transduction histidine kinase